MVPGHKRQTCDLALVVQTERIVSFYVIKSNFAQPSLFLVLEQRFSIGGAHNPRGCEKGLLGVRTSLIIQKTTHQMVQGVPK